MRSNRGYLDVVVPPSIIDSKTSPDQVVKEGAAVNLTCGARGSPTPKIMWKREDNKMIHYKVRMGVKSFYGIIIFFEGRVMLTIESNFFFQAFVI